MPWAIMAVAAAVLVGAWYAGKGHLGEMPDLVDDRPVPRLPEGDFTAADLRGLYFARPPEGYKPLQVERLLENLARQLDEEPATNDLTSHDVLMSRFDVVHRGYSMEQVDHVLARIAQQLGREVPQEAVGTASSGAEETASGQAEEPVQVLSPEQEQAVSVPDGAE